MCLFSLGGVSVVLKMCVCITLDVCTYIPLEVCLYTPGGVSVHFMPVCSEWVFRYAMVFNAINVGPYQLQILVLPHLCRSNEELENVEITHHVPQNAVDKVCTWSKFITSLGLKQGSFVMCICWVPCKVVFRLKAAYPG